MEKFCDEYDKFDTKIRYQVKFHQSYDAEVTDTPSNIINGEMQCILNGSQNHLKFSIPEDEIKMISDKANEEKLF